MKLRHSLVLQTLALVAVMFSALLCLNCAAMAAGDGACHESGPPADGGKPTVTYDSDRLSIEYRVLFGDCELMWRIRKHTTGGNELSNRSECTKPLREQLPALKKVLSAVLSDKENSDSVTSLYWGRLYPDTKSDALEMSFRLALAAFKSSQWDATQGKPKSGDPNGFVIKLANDAMIYQELKDLFAGSGRGIKFSSAEKVLVTKAADLPFYEELKKKGVKPTDRLPFDCMTHFAIPKTK